VASAYEFALKNVGLDMNSGSLWSEYIHLLKTAPAPTQAEIGERVARVRRAYQRAVVVPTNHVEALFRDYDRFEHDLNKELARKLLSEVHTRHLNALMAYKQKKKRAALINTTMMARPTPRNPHEQQREYQQLQLWLDLIAYEKTNPQVLDAAELRTRVVFAYKQALLTLRHYPEVWSDYAAFVAESASVEEGAKVFQQAEEALPHK
jgi:cleavage stimulation factor subunit 3